MVKNAFYFLLNALFVLGYVQKRLDKRAKVNSKFMKSQTGQQIITIHILLNISISKDNQKMKFGQLIEYRKSFFENIIHKMRWRSYSQTLL